MSAPTLSIGLPVYNHGRFVAETIRSILANEYEDFELIISNNGSTDDTDAVVRHFDDARIRYLHRDKPLQIEAHFEQVLSHARGRYFALFHSDDIYSDRILGEELRVLENSDPPVAAVVTSGYTFFDGSDRRPLPMRFRGRGRQVLFDYDRYLRSCLRGRNPFAYPTACYRTEVVRRFGYRFTSDYLGAQDVAQWLAILRAGYQIAHVNKRLFHYRVHDQAARYTAYRLSPLVQVLEREMAHLDASPAHRSKSYYQRLFTRLRFSDRVRYHVSTGLGGERRDLSPWRMVSNAFRDRELRNEPIGWQRTRVIWHLTRMLFADYGIKPRCRRLLARFGGREVPAASETYSV